MRRFFLPALFILILVRPVFSQPKISIQLGPEYTFLSNSEDYLPVWKEGWGITTGLNIITNDYNQINLIISYVSLPYTGDKGTFPVAGTEDTLEVFGQESSLFNFSVGTRFFLTGTFIEPFAGAQVGISLLRKGLVEEYYTSENNSIYSTSFGEDEFLFTAALRAGARYKIIPILNIVAEVKLLSTFNKAIFFPASLSLELVLP